jgi:hypothetical protein
MALLDSLGSGTSPLGPVAPGIGDQFMPGGPHQGEFENPSNIDAILQDAYLGHSRAAPKPRKSNPSIDLVAKKAKQDIAQWQKREERFQRHQEMVELKKPDVSPDQDAVVMSDPLGILSKVTGSLAKQKVMREVRARRPEMRDSAQAIENGLILFDERRERDWVDSLHNPVQYDELQSGLLRGWYCARVAFDSEQAAQSDAMDDFDYFPWIVDVFDPANVYPNSPSGKYTRVTHRYWTTIGDLLDNSEFPDAEKILEEYDDESKVVEVTAVYEFNDRWDYHCAFLSDCGEPQFLKSPAPMGYMPWVIVLAGGFFSRQTPWNGKGNTDYTGGMGVGIMHTIEQNQSYLNRYASMAMTTLGDAANSYMGLFTDGDEDQVPEDGFKRGGSGKFAKDAKILPIHSIQNMEWILPALKMFEERNFNYLLPKMAFAAGDGAISSGYMASLFMNAASDIIFPYVRAWELFRAKISSATSAPSKVPSWCPRLQPRNSPCIRGASSSRRMSTSRARRSSSPSTLCPSRTRSTWVNWLSLWSIKISSRGIPHEVTITSGSRTPSSKT